MTTLLDRRIEFDECFNFRDLGGYPTEDGRTVRWRTLLRSDALHHMTNVDVVRLRDLGIRTVIDLRSTEEVSREGIGLLPPELLRLHLPLFEAAGGRPDHESDAVPSLQDIYVAMLQRCAARIVDVLELLADPDRLPAVFHCTAGKDRTGIIAAVVLSAVGVDDEVVVADYVLTAERIDRIAGRVMATSVFAGSLVGMERHAFECPPELMRSMLDALQLDHEGVHGFLTAHGASADLVPKLVANLLE